MRFHLGREKDTLRNIIESGEFVVNLAPAALLEEVNATGTNFPADVSEFDAAGVTREPSLTVGAQRVKESRGGARMPSPFDSAGWGLHPDLR